MAYVSGAYGPLIMILYLIMLQNSSTAAQRPTTLITAKNHFPSPESTINYTIAQVNQDNQTQTSQTSNEMPQNQRLGLQLIIQDAPNETRRNNSSDANDASKSGAVHIMRDDTNKSNGDSDSSHSARRENKTNTHKSLTRPYDLQYAVGNTLELHSPNLLKNLYLLELENIRKMNKMEGLRRREKEPPRRKIMNQRSELVRTQHRPPWRWRDSPSKPYHDDLTSPDLIGRRYKLRFTTMMPATFTTTTEFFKLISSAHSPVRYFNTPHPIALQERTGNIITANKLRGTSGTRTRTSRAPMIINYDTTSKVTPTTYPASIASRFKLNPPEDRVLSPAIMVKGGESESESSGNRDRDRDRDRDHGRDRDRDRDRDSVRDTDNIVRAGNFDNTISNNHANNSLTGNSMSINDLDYGHDNYINEKSGFDKNNNMSPANDSSREINTSLQFDDDQELSPKYSPLTFFNGKRPVTIIRHTKPKLPPIILLPSRIRTPPPTSSPAQFVRLISKQKYKYDDKVMSPTLTVVDSDFNRLPPNSTSVHNNKLIVAIRPGRPRGRRPTTTQFPVYNIVAGITPPYPNNPPVMTHTRPPSYDGTVYGLLRPNGSDSSSAASHNPSSFGSPNIKFPAAEPTSLLPEHVDPLPDKFNITVPDSAHNVSPNNVPDKIIIESDEQHSRPPDALVSSDAHIVSRPNGSNSVSTQNGIMQIRTTRKPSRGSTTPRVSIVSANTTVVTTNPEQLHEVLSNVIDSHQQDHHTHVYQSNNNNNNRPHFFTSVLNYLSNMINSGVATSAVAILTLMKTIFVALLVMFLPPMALAAAILQVISIG